MNNTITNIKLQVRSKHSGETYTAQYVVERPAGQYGMVWAWIWIDTEFGIWLDAYKPTVSEAIECLRQQVRGKWERA